MACPEDPESRERQSQRYQDEEDDSRPDAWEPVYRDGTPRHECWGADLEGFGEER